MNIWKNKLILTSMAFCLVLPFAIRAQQSTSSPQDTELEQLLNGSATSPTEKDSDAAVAPADNANKTSSDSASNKSLPSPPSTEGPQESTATAGSTNPEQNIVTIQKPELPAATTETKTQSRPKSPALEEIVVTAQRREENLQNVPISITV